MDTCLNCNTALQPEYRFCHQCGQKHPTPKLSLKVIFHEFIHAFLHADKSIFNLMKQLAIRPGHVAREYADGKRKKYFNPFTFLVLVVGLSSFAFAASHVLDVSSNSPAAAINRYIYKYYNVLVFLTTPLIAWFSWLVHKKSGRNYAENLLLTTFLSGERALGFSILVAPLLYVFKHHYFYVLYCYLFLWMIYFAWGSMQFFGGSKRKQFLRSLLPPFLAQLLTTVIMTIIVITYLKMRQR